ncbi:metalloregulator ArsR/SmtB family transcription factor [uncultured Demequina sp.]|uniref:helix-turn-helix transcriptional regulator n=1 Tax=uncultured Demequina sp. TaxID=693499 RepID=UPI0025FD337B|nr:helix-turn-helix domain-containing protein [uncultured Demequina sp.]
MAGVEDLETRRHAALASGTRRRILDQLARSPGGVPISEVSARLGLHQNTVRAHLEILEDAELAAAEIDRTGRPGRPRQVYRALQESPQPVSHVRSVHGDFAKALLAGFGRAGGDAAVRAQVAAERLGGHHGAEVAEDSGSAADAVTAAFDVAGVEVDWRADGAALIRACPVPDLARLRPDVVCPIHATLIQAALDEGAGIERVSVTPDPEGVCVIRGVGMPAPVAQSSSSSASEAPTARSSSSSS